VKADGLCAGKGVAVCDGPEDALRALDEMMGARRFGEAGARVLIEERLVGEEVSYYAVTDGERVATLPAAQDHKRALDGDRGENTGGMGAYAPAPLVTPAVEKRISRRSSTRRSVACARTGRPTWASSTAGSWSTPRERRA